MINWKHLGVNLGMFLGGLLPIVIPAYIDIRSRIDDGKDEQRAHWVADRKHKDSVNQIFQDTVLFYLKHERTARNH